MRKLTTNVQVFRKINKKQLFELNISFNKVKCLRKIETGSSFIDNTFLYNDFMNEIIFGHLKPTGEKGDGQKLIKHYL